MASSETEYSKSNINRAGRVLRDPASSATDKDNALDVLDYWRAIHSYPMQVFYMRLKNASKNIDKNALTSQRLKRAYSIIAKLRRRYHGRNPSMDLYQMQDISGCRATLSTVDLAKKLSEDYYIKGELKHKRVGKKDYIENPKEDGYRSIHLIYKYNSDKERKKKYNGLLVEVQIRSRLQHLWATAVETAGLFTREAIKSSEGSPEWLEFFKLVSSAFAKREHCPVVPGTPDDDQELYRQIAQKERALNIISKMQGWASALNVFNERTKKKGDVRFFLLELDIKGEKLTIHSYTKREEQQALTEYATVENRYSGNKEYDVVLVGVAAAHDLENAYPNYYADTNEFLSTLRKIIAKY
jgi:ppGpp synthetase/RelA/SpoT-type nucleotidyltranferase